MAQLLQRGVVCANVSGGGFGTETEDAGLNSGSNTNCFPFLLSLKGGVRVSRPPNATPPG